MKITKILFLTIICSLLLPVFLQASTGPISETAIKRAWSKAAEIKAKLEEEGKPQQVGEIHLKELIIDQLNNQINREDALLYAEEMRNYLTNAYLEKKWPEIIEKFGKRDEGEDYSLYWRKINEIKDLVYPNGVDTPEEIEKVADELLNRLGHSYAKKYVIEFKGRLPQEYLKQKWPEVIEEQ